MICCGCKSSSVTSDWSRRSRNNKAPSRQEHLGGGRLSPGPGPTVRGPGDIRNSDRLDNIQVGATLAVPVTRRQSLRVSYSDGAITRAGGAYRLI
jgi:hypothetical protein